jgi:hypothetical protein
VIPLEHPESNLRHGSTRSLSKTLLLLGLAVGIAASTSHEPEVIVQFDQAGVAEVPQDVRELIRATAADVAGSVDELLPGLGERIDVTVVTVDRDLSSVGGVAGRAEAPGEVLVEVSAVYPGGLGEAIRAGLPSVLYHEFHHLVRGWTIRENRFGPGIPIAVVNEGLASVFAETYSGTSGERFDYPDDAAEWLEELMALPIDADYNTWMNDHPDGRVAIGYRTGRYVVHEALRRSGRSILELSGLSSEQILALAMGSAAPHR